MKYAPTRPQTAMARPMGTRMKIRASRTGKDQEASSIPVMSMSSGGFNRPAWRVLGQAKLDQGLGDVRQATDDGAHHAQRIRPPHRHLQDEGGFKVFTL